MKMNPAEPDEPTAQKRLRLWPGVVAVPLLSLALVSWAAATRRLSTGSRRASMVAAILLACGVFTLVRTGGISGEGASELHWRWTPTPEERLLSQDRDKPAGGARAAG